MGNLSDTKQDEAEEDMKIVERKIHSKKYKPYGTKENPIKIAVNFMKLNQKVNWGIWIRKICINYYFDQRVSSKGLSLINTKLNMSDFNKI
jgi:hypothetical protein